MEQNLKVHGSEGGYRAHLEAGTSCERCTNAHRVFNKQYTQTGKKQGLKYGKNQVIDNLYTPTGKGHRRGVRPGVSGPGQDQPRTGQDQSSRIPPGYPQDAHTGTDAGQDGSGPGPDQGAPSRSLGDRLREGLFSLKAERRGTNEYVDSEPPDDYIHPITPDPEPGDTNWSEVKSDDYVITAKDISQIKDNLASYIFTAGMAMGLLDPYCGAAIRENAADMIEGWANVISKYPNAARMFAAKGGGKIMAWLDALMATFPVLIAIYEHHLAHTVQIDSVGRAVRVTPGRESPNGHFATQPDFNYTVD